MDSLQEQLVLLTKVLSVLQPQNLILNNQLIKNLNLNGSET